MNKRSSRIPGYHQLSHQEKLITVSKFTGISLERLSSILQPEMMRTYKLDGLVENCIGGMVLPVGIAPNFRINGKDYLVPMAVEESSVVAAASYGAKLAYQTGGFESHLVDNLMIGQTQFQVYGRKDFQKLQKKIETHLDELIDDLNDCIPKLVNRGGGVRSLYLRGPFQYKDMTFAIVQFDVDVKDAMGANLINKIAEKLGELLNHMVSGHSHTSILSNLSTKRVVCASCKIAMKDLASRAQWDDVQRRIDLTQGFAEVDPFRAVTHNKGIMNGIDAVLLATGNDWRANAAGAYGYAALSGRIKPLSHWRVEQPYIYGEIEVPVQVGIVGGVTRIHPVAKTCLDILDIKNGQELAELTAAVGLAQNFSAIRALAFEGIIEGHMKLHQYNLEKHQEIEGDRELNLVVCHPGAGRDPL